MDGHRLLQASEQVDEAAGARQANAPDMPSRNWRLDDMPPFLFLKRSPNSHGFVSPRNIERQWRDQFDWVYRECEYAIFIISIHPDVSGRPEVLLMLERLYGHMIRHAGVTFTTLDAMADDFARRQPT